MRSLVSCRASLAVGFSSRRLLRILNPPCPSPSLDFYPDGTVVRAGHVAADEGALEAGPQPGGHEHIINAPANISIPHAGHRTPPGVMAAALFKFAEGVNEL